MFFQHFTLAPRRGIGSLRRKAWEQEFKSSVTVFDLLKIRQEFLFIKVLTAFGDNLSCILSVSHTVWTVTILKFGRPS